MYLSLLILHSYPTMLALTLLSTICLVSGVALAEEDPRYYCPEYGMDFAGNDVYRLENVPTWHECGMFFCLL